MLSATHSVRSSAGPFSVTVLQPTVAKRCVVFAAGRGGNPLRHFGLLQDLVNRDLLVIAPHFDMLTSAIPGMEDLAGRVHRLASTIEQHCPADLSLCGLGHSIGTVVLLVAAGAVATTLSGDELADSSFRAFSRLVLLAPPTDFFRRPGALASVSVPIQVWSGGQDSITPQAQARFLVGALDGKTGVDLRIEQRAGHFTFMDELPPHVSDPHPDRAGFLRALAADASRFLEGDGRE
ncbi:hypothetical protein O4H66_06615 [Comamonadaceae bacterium G21597-S1]|nr:hypothetical protein [Comamonadaceae bacterium G21597-S1]